ncbi:MAG: MarR family transcriptional regulator [Phycisphaerales bacterium]|nr:MAG: MarR family transcriptional regulator [Phycisphaerales bacterium]
MHNSRLEAATALFIRRWGEMGASWGISRTMAEIHALLFLTTEPLCTDDIMERLQVSRGSASTNLRQLVNWGLIYRVHQRGDRKEYFEAEHDVWQMFEIITRERSRREVQPIVETIEKCLEMISQDGDAETTPRAEAARRRMAAMHDFFSTMNRLFNLMVKVGPRGLSPMTRAIEKLQRLA